MGVGDTEECLTDCNTVVCVLPGTELAFATPARCYGRGGLLGWKPRVFKHATAIFRQVNKDYPRTHHDALEFPDGQMVLLNDMLEGQEATVLQLPAQPVIAAETRAENGFCVSVDLRRPHSRGGIAVNGPLMRGSAVGLDQLSD